MNVLALIRKQLAKRDALSQSQFLMTKTYRGIDYTSAHQSPTKLTST
jgi:hypothetical protein